MSKMDEMVDGYLWGISCETPPYDLKKKSPAFKHGWENGCADRLGKPKDPADVRKRRAAMILGEPLP